jgi:hypothetical protein
MSGMAKGGKSNCTCVKAQSREGVVRSVCKTDSTARGLKRPQQGILSLLASIGTTYPEIHSHFQASVLSDQLFCNLQTRYDFLKLFKHVIKV